MTVGQPTTGRNEGLSNLTRRGTVFVRPVLMYLNAGAGCARVGRARSGVYGGGSPICGSGRPTCGLPMTGIDVAGSGGCTGGNVVMRRPRDTCPLAGMPTSNITSVRHHGRTAAPMILLYTRQASAGRN